MKVRTPDPTFCPTACGFARHDPSVPAHRPWLSLVFSSVFLVLAAFAQGSQEETTFALYSAEGKAGTGHLRKIAADWTIRLGGAGPVLVNGQDFVALRRQTLALPAFPSGEQVILATGDRIPLAAGGVLKVGDEFLTARVQPPLGMAPWEEIKVPLARVALLWLGPSSRTANPALELRRLLSARRRTDQVLLKSGDVIEGTVLALNRQNDCQVRAGAKTLAVPLDRIAAVAFSTELLVSAVPREPFAHLIVDNGARLNLASATLEGSKLNGKTLFGVAVTVPLQHVAALDLRHGRAVYLSDLEPVQYKHVPFLGVSWPFVRDGSVAGRELRLAGSTFDKGLGMHAESHITFDLAGQYDWFEALVGLDSQTGKRGSARIAVLVDGKDSEGAKGQELKAGAAPLPIRLNLHGARRLTLVVRPASLGDVQAHVNWADARLIKAK
jgi:hypothetical protein